MDFARSSCRVTPDSGSANLQQRKLPSRQTGRMMLESALAISSAASAKAAAAAATCVHSDSTYQPTTHSVHSARYSPGAHPGGGGSPLLPVSLLHSLPVLVVDGGRGWAGGYDACMELLDDDDAAAASSVLPLASAGRDLRTAPGQSRPSSRLRQLLAGHFHSESPHDIGTHMTIES